LKRDSIRGLSVIFFLVLAVGADDVDVRRESRIYALCVSVVTYQERDIPPLSGMQCDVQRFVRFLKSDYGGKVPSKNILCLYDKEATRENVLRAFPDFLAKARKQDRVYIYFNMHGSTSRGLDGSVGKKYFFLYDSSLANMSETALRMSDFPRLFYKHVKAEKAVIFFQTCMSGACVDAFKKYTGSKRTHVAVIASSPGDKFSWALRFVGGVYGILLTNGLNGGADANRDGRVTIAEIIAYLKVYVSVCTLSYQLPVCYVDPLMEQDVLSRGVYFHIWDAIRKYPIWE